MFDSEEIKNKQILVLGSNGFLGRNICNHLKSFGFKVYGLSRNENESNPNEISLTALIKNYKKYNFSTAIFCGNPPVTINKKAYFKETFSADIEKAKIFKNLGFNQIIWTGSYWQDLVEQGFQSETLYTKSKRLTEQGILALAQDSFHVTSIRIGDTYGPDDSRKKIIPEMTRAVEVKRLFTIQEPNSQMNLVFIDDVALGFGMVVNTLNTSQTVYSLYADSLISVKDLIDEFQKVFPEFNCKIGKIRQTPEIKVCFNLGVYPRPVNWSPKISLKQGLENLKMIDFNPTS